MEEWNDRVEGNRMFFKSCHDVQAELQKAIRSNVSITTGQNMHADQTSREWLKGIIDKGKLSAATVEGNYCEMLEPNLRSASTQPIVGRKVSDDHDFHDCDRLELAM